MRFTLQGYSVLLCSFFIMYNATARIPSSCCEFPPVDEIRELLRDAAPHDVRLLLNLLYWSHERSCSTIVTQAAAERNLREQWDAWQSCADRRLNPKAGAAPFREHVHHHMFESLQKEFHNIHSQYSSIVALTTDACRYTHQPIAFFVEALREQARQHVMHIMKQHLTVVAKELEQQLGSQALALRLDRRGLISYLINQIAVASFAQLDASWRGSSNQLMLQFLAIQGLFNDVWNTIETARTTFYKTYFNLIINVMHEYQFPPISFTNLAQLPGEAEPVAFVLALS